MEYNMQTDNISVVKTILDSSSEQPIDMDFILPDYCPDIQKILKCSIEIKVTLKQLTDSQLNIEGDIYAKILYNSANDKKIKFCEHSIPFSHSFTVKTSVDDINMPMVYVSNQIEYINCRAVSPRKLDVHGAFILFAKILCKTSKEIILGIDNEDVEEKKENVEVSNIISILQQQFSLSEILELSQGKPPIEYIIRSELRLNLIDKKILENKLIIKADAFLKILYISDMENSEMNTMEYTIPVSQIIDVDNLNEDTKLSIELSSPNYSLSVRPDSSGDDNLIELEARLVANIITYDDINISILSDAYSKKYEMSLDYKIGNFEKIIDFINDPCTNKTNLTVGEDGISEIIDVWCEDIQLKATHSDDSILFNGKFKVCVLALNELQEGTFIEKNIDFEHSYSFTPTDNIKLNCIPSIVDISYRITGSGDIEVKTDISVKITVIQVKKQKFVCYAFADEDKEIVKDNTALIIYYAGKGENVWDIARHYGSCMGKIIKENDLPCEELDDSKILVIPI